MKDLKIFGFILLVFMVFPLISQENIAKRDYKISRNAYILKYAQDDSTLNEAINLYFDKRASGINKVLAFPIGLTIATISSVIYFTANKKEVRSLSGFGIIFGGASMVVGVPVGVSGIRILKNHSRKNLYLAIMQIKSGQMSAQDFYNKIHER